MPWLAADSELPFQSSEFGALYVLLTKHSFPSHLHQELTVHKSVPKPTATASPWPTCFPFSAPGSERLCGSSVFSLCVSSVPLW